MSEPVTLEGLQEALPNRKNSITQEAVDIINSSLHDPEFQGEAMLTTAITYEAVLKRNKASIPEYLRAIKFCAFISTEETSLVSAFIKVFGHRKFVQERRNAPTDSTKYTELTSAASRYRKNKLVVDILTVSQVPLDLIFTGHRYRAIGVLAEIMENSIFDRDRVAAAKELLAATKGPENVKIELDVGIKGSSAVEQMNDQLNMIATRQEKLLAEGSSRLEDFGSMKVKDADFIDADYTEE